MSTETLIVAAHLFQIGSPQLSFEEALQIVKKEMKETGQFIRPDICFRGNRSIKRKCLACFEEKSIYGNGQFNVCAKCLLPKTIYSKYLDTKHRNPTLVLEKNPDFDEKMEIMMSQLAQLSKK